MTAGMRGAPAPGRIEDAAMLTGRAGFTAEHAAGACVGRFVRSAMAHARITAIDTGAARATRGVLAVFTMAELDALLPGVPAPLDTVRNQDGTITPVPPRPALARFRVRFAGEALAIVVATSAAAAADGAEAVIVDYDELPAISAAGPGPAEIHDGVPGGLGFDWAGGDAAAAGQAFAQAAHIVSSRITVPRILGVPLEPAGAVASYDEAAGRWTLIVPSQGAHAIQRELATCYLGVEPDRLRVVTPDVGGAFGLRIHALPEHAVLLAAARLAGRPIAWQSDRSESNLCEPHARDLVVEAELALDGDGRFLGLRASALCNLGAYVHPGARGTPTASLLFGLQGAYRMPALSLRVRGYYTNTTPTGPFRGAGQPEGTYVIERLIDTAGGQTGFPPAILRQRNALAAADFPYLSASGHKVDSGGAAALLQQATTWLRRCPVADAAGLRHGSGIALYMKVNGMGRQEQAEVAVTAESDFVLVRIGSQSNGQGHATTIAAIVADQLGLGLADIQVVQGDTDAVAFGTGTGASSVLGTTGAGVSRSCADLLRRAREAAARYLGAPQQTLDYAGGRFGAPGTNRFVTLRQLAKDEGGELAGRSEVGVTLSYTFGCHACIVGVDSETGLVRLLDYAAFDDLGPLLQPAIAAGQIHGGVAQGIGQALLEAMQYAGAAQPVTASLLDYCLPRAADLPAFVCEMAETPAAATDLGVRGAGEAGAVASMAAVVNAVAGAIGAGCAIDAPLTPERVWWALRDPALLRRATHGA